MTLRHLAGVLCGAAVYLLALYQPAWPLGYPTPQPKPCRTYWNSSIAARLAANDPNVIAYTASTHEVIAKFKDGSGIMVYHDPKGCLVVTPLSQAQVRDYLAWLRPGRAA